MKALIVGAAGFVGGYLARHLLAEYGWTVIATKLPSETAALQGVRMADLDILDADAVSSLLQEEKPNFIFHLAAQSSVALSWKFPQLTLDVNLKGSLNLLEGIRLLNYKPRVLLVGSSEEYGRIRPADLPISEECSLKPANIYALSKAALGMLGSLYANTYDLPIIMVRAFNHIGVGQAPQFAVSDFCRQVANIECGKQESVIRVGNLSAIRDFLDVRDVVRAYVLLMINAPPNENYNVGSGRGWSISELLQKILRLANCPITVLVDKQKYRPVDAPEIVADVRKLQQTINWTPFYDIDDTIAEILNYWRYEATHSS